MKTVSIILATFLYCAFMTFALYYISNNVIERRHISLLTHLPMLFFSVVLMCLRNGSKNTYIDGQLYMIGEFTIISFLALYCLNSFGYIHGVTNKLIFFNGLNVAFISIVLTSGFRHGIFKKR